ncbi:MAG TPA: SPW repeat protein [Gemmatimonadaceae bacterium]
MEMTVAHRHDSQVRTATGLAFLAGLWLIITPWIYGVASRAGLAWNSIIVGIIVAVLSAIRFLAPRSAVAASWIVALAGVWTIISPWIYGYASNVALLWNSVIVGIIVAILGVWSASAGRGEVAV